MLCGYIGEEFSMQRERVQICWGMSRILEEAYVIEVQWKREEWKIMRITADDSLIIYKFTSFYFSVRIG